MFSAQLATNQSCFAAHRLLQYFASHKFALCISTVPAFFISRTHRGSSCHPIAYNASRNSRTPSISISACPATPPFSQPRSLPSAGRRPEAPLLSALPGRTRTLSGRNSAGRRDAADPLSVRGAARQPSRGAASGHVTAPARCACTVRVTPLAAGCMCDVIQRPMTSSMLSGRARAPPSRRRRCAVAVVRVRAPRQG